MASADDGTTRADADFEQLQQRFAFDGEVAEINHHRGNYRLLGRTGSVTEQSSCDDTTEDLKDA